MKNTVAITAITLLLSPGISLGANARSDRSVLQFRQDRYRAAVINSQWAAQFRAGRADTVQSYSSNLAERLHSRLGRIQDQAWRNRMGFFQSGPVVSIRRR